MTCNVFIISFISFISSMVFASSVLANPLNINQQYGKQSLLKPQLLRDPFTPSNLMYEIASNSALNGSGNGFLPSQGSAAAIPNMKLKGYVGAEGEDGFALLEIQGAGTFMVKEGDEINYNPRQPRSAIRITRIDRASVTIETGLIGTFRVQR